jgi:hypothetical protein
MQFAVCLSSSLADQIWQMKYGTLPAVETDCCTGQECSGPEAPDSSGVGSLEPCMVAWKVGACQTVAVADSRQRN